MKKLRLVTILGTRPELIRLSITIKKCDKLFDHILIHTGQNYDYELNQIFFDQLDIRKPDYFLDAAGENLGQTLGNIISKSYDILESLKPDSILVLGDTNSSLCLLSAKRLKIPIFHMEAGNRCFDQNVPEEINRKIADHLADVNLSYTENSRRYILSEGFRKDHVFNTGSPLVEVLNYFENKIDNSEILKKLGVDQKKYIVASIHREENLDIGKNFKQIIEALNLVVKKYDFPLVFSTHPRTKEKLKQIKTKESPKINFIKPLGFFDYVKLQKESFIALSDSGTISEESSIINFPAVSIRTSTERPEAIDYGTILLGNIDKDSIMQSVEVALKTFRRGYKQIPSGYKVLNSSDRVIKIIQGYTKIINREIWRK